MAANDWSSLTFRTTPGVPVPETIQIDMTYTSFNTVTDNSGATTTPYDPFAKTYWWIAVAHVVLTVGGFYFVAAYAQGYADAGGLVAPGWLALLRVTISGVLMQPILYAVLSLDLFRWWTTLGLIIFTIVAALNTLVAVGILWIIVRTIRRIHMIAASSRES